MLEIRDLKVRLGESEILKGIQMNIGKGEKIG
jgi:Fe-S cluster assembly ATPase SufC